MTPTGQISAASREVVLDDRERASGLDAALAEALGAPPRIERLVVGDLLVGGRFLIERKSAADFAASIVDGRLFRQAAELTRQRFEAIMIVEGDFGAEGGPKIDAAALRGAMLSLALDWRIPLLRSKSIRDTAGWIAALVRWMAGSAAPPDWRGVTPTGARRARAATPARPARRESPREAKRRAQPVSMLAQIAAIGPKKAQALLDHFGSFGAVAQAPISELLKVEGIGKTLAGEIHAALGSRPETAPLRAKERT